MHLDVSQIRSLAQVRGGGVSKSWAPLGTGAKPPALLPLAHFQHFSKPERLSGQSVRLKDNKGTGETVEFAEIPELGSPLPHENCV